MAYYYIDQWAREATAKIRFAPDRAWVSEELRAHLEDRKDALMERGLEEREAERKAIESMGPPEEIADELAALHSPWPGWIWRASKITLWIAVVVMVITVLAEGYRFGDLIAPIAGHITLNLQMDPEWKDLRASEGAALATREAVSEVEKAVSTTASGRFWRVNGGRVIAYHEEGKDPEYTLYLDFWSLTPRFWDLLSDMVGRNLTAKDSLGNTYPAIDAVETSEVEKYTAGDQNVDGLFYCRMLVMVMDFDPAAEWVDLICDRSDDPFTLRIMLEEVEQ